MIDDVFIRPLTDAFGDAQQLLFEPVVQPIVFPAGQVNLLEAAYPATGWPTAGRAGAGCWRP